MRGSYHDSSASDEGSHRTTESLIVRGRGVLASYEDDVPPVPDGGKAHCLSEPPFCFVAYDSIPHTLPHRVADTRHIQAVGPRHQHKQAVGPGTPLPPGGCEILGSGETPLIGHRPTGCDGRSSDREPAPALEHTAL